MNRNNIEIFRGKLQNILDSIEDNGPCSYRIRAVVKALKTDYNRLFSKEHVKEITTKTNRFRNLDL